MDHEIKFDFEAHGRVAADGYRKQRPTHKRFASAIQLMLERALPKVTPIHRIEKRTKKVASFEQKARTRAIGNAASPKYADPLAEITDKTGIRVITFLPNSVELVCQAIETEFDIIEKVDKGEERFARGDFGYQSIHYLVKVREARLQLPEYSEYRDQVAEIQVRTIRQHAWAEMEHDIQYKTEDQIPVSTRRRFVALAGALEIADREFQAIQDEDARLRSSVKAALEDDLTNLNIAPNAEGESSGAIDEAEESTQDLKDLKDLKGWSPGKARTLLAEGKYAKAIDIYSRIIELFPKHYTAYLGRARARFLDGDRKGALDDIEFAEANLPADRNIGELKRRIGVGVVTPPKTSMDYWKVASRGNTALAGGRAQEAFRLYSEAQQLGLLEFFSQVNKAMACVLRKDVDGAAYFLDQIRPHRKSPSEVNICALKAIIAVIAKRGAKNATEVLQDMVADFPDYKYDLSPLRFLEQGLYARDTTVADGIERVFDILRSKRDN